MAKFVIEVDVDVDKLALDDDISVEGIIEEEMGWVEESGIKVVSVKKVN